MTLRLVFMGSPAFAVPSLRALHAAGHHVVAVVCQPDAPRDRGQKLQAPAVKEAAVALGLHVLQPERVKGPRGAVFLDEVRRLAPDLAVVAAYGKILPQELLDVPRGGCVNLHASLLPRFRGASPIQHAILEGDRETGVCLMRMVLELDAGGVFATARTAISDDDTSETLTPRLAELAAGLCTAHLEDVAAGRLPEVPQASAGMTYAPLLTRELGRIDWNGDARREARRVRAMAGWPGTSTTFRGEPLKIHAARAVDGTARPGVIVGAGAAGLDVACGQGVLRLLEVQPAGKKRMAAADWLRGARLAAGDSLVDAPA